MAADDRLPPEARAGLADMLSGLAYLTRIPGLASSAPATAPGDLAAAAWSFPVIGAAIGLAGGIALIISGAVGLPPALAAAIAILAIAALTGAMHEAGLAAIADAAGAGPAAATRSAALRDRHLGASGVLSLVFSVLLRAGALAGLVFQGEATAVFVLMAAEAASRAAMVRMWSALPPAIGADPVGPAPDERVAMTAIIIGAAVAAVLTVILAGPAAAIVALAGTAAAALAFEGFCRRAFGGCTAATLGAAQQVGVAIYLLLALAFS